MQEQSSARRAQKKRTSRYRETLTSAHWRDVCRLRASMVDERCEGCGAQLRLAGHHWRGYAMLGSETTDDIWMLCSRCHLTLHTAQRTWRRLTWPFAVVVWQIRKGLRRTGLPQIRVRIAPERKGDTQQSDTVEAEPEPRRQGPPEIPRLYVDVQLVDRPGREGKLAEQLLNIWEHHIFPTGMDGDYESTYRVNNRGRPMCSLDGEQWLTYNLTRALEDCRLQGLNGEAAMGYLSRVRMLTAAGQLTVDHSCENRKCDKVDDLAWEGRGPNSELWHERRRDEVRGVGSAAD